MADYSITAVTRRKVYSGSAGVGPYAFTFPILVQTDIAVYKNSTKLTLTTDYTVTINGTNGTGSVTLVSAATGSDTITIIGARAIQRTTDFVTAGDLAASSLNEQLDANIIMTQQLAEENKRTLKAPQYDPESTEDGGTLNMTLPVAATRASKTLAFDSSGNPVAGPTVSEVANAQTYATNAAASASAASTSASNASSSASTASTAASNASSSASSASSSASSASSSASSASTSASNASTSATNAASSASSASTSASNAASSASSASSSATAAQSAQTAAEAARDQTLSAFDSFDDRYLGTKTSDPTVDNDGNPLVAGALYFNSVAGEMRVYTGSAWVAAYVSGTGFVAKVGGLTGAADIPVGTTGERPAASTGYFRFNTSLTKFEGYNGTAWGAVGGGATGGGSDDIFVENGQTVTTNYTLTAGKNAMSAGPISINSGITVTVPSGAVWTIV
jgi:hypothetical protein